MERGFCSYCGKPIGMAWVTLMHLNTADPTEGGEVIRFCDRLHLFRFLAAST